MSAFSPKSDAATDASMPNASVLELEALRAQYLDLINNQLPLKAKQIAMPVRFNHCFARIVLDNLFEDCWYHHLSGKQPAYKQLTGTQLLRAIALASSILDSPKTAKALNQNSLRWRGKA